MGDTGERDRVQRGFPPVVYAPTTTVAGDDRLRLEMVVTNDGRTALFVYSAIDRLHEFYRAGAPWALLSVEDLQRAHEQEPYQLLFLDQRPRPATEGTEHRSEASS
jgi:hypothetical protein